MTDEAPKEIWLTGFTKDQYGARLGHGTVSDLDHKDNPDYPKYLRADHALALVAEAYEVAATEMDRNAAYWSENCNDAERVIWDGEAKAIRALTPADAQAAREALIAETRRKALEEAAGIVRALAPTIEHDSTQDDRMHESILERAARHIERAVE